MSELTGYMTIPMAPGELTQVLGRSLDIAGTVMTDNQVSLVQADVAFGMAPEHAGYLVQDANHIAVQGAMEDGGRLLSHLVSRQSGGETSCNVMAIPPAGSEAATVTRFLDVDSELGLVQVERGGVPGANPEDIREQLQTAGDAAVTLAGLARFALVRRLTHVGNTTPDQGGHPMSLTGLVGRLLSSSGRAVTECDADRRADISVTIDWRDYADGQPFGSRSDEMPQHIWINAADSRSAASASFALLYTGQVIAACTLTLHDPERGLDVQEFARTAGGQIEHMTIIPDAQRNISRHIVPAGFAKLAGMADRVRRFAAGEAEVADLI